jgi:hypothetical protein
MSDQYQLAQDGGNIHEVPLELLVEISKQFQNQMSVRRAIGLRSVLAVTTFELILGKAAHDVIGSVEHPLVLQVLVVLALVIAIGLLWIMLLNIEGRNTLDREVYGPLADEIRTRLGINAAEIGRPRTHVSAWAAIWPGAASSALAVGLALYIFLLRT